MPRFYAILFWSLCTQSWGATPESWIHERAELEGVYQASAGFLGVRWVKAADGSSRVLARTQTNPFGAPTVCPFIQVASPGSVPELFIRAAAEQVAHEYESGRHPLDPELASWIRLRITQMLQARDPRAIWYEIHAPYPPEDPRRVAGTMLLFDATSSEAKPLAPMETFLQWLFPERPAVHGQVELLFTFKNSAVELEPLDARQLLREVGTYLDLFYLSRGIPVTVRLLTLPDRARVFRSALYGFQAEWQPKGAWDVLKMDGSRLVERFGSHWPQWKQMYGLERGPANPLLDPRPLQTQIERRLARANAYFSCHGAITEQGQSFSSVEAYLDGLFEAVLESEETPLLF
ncbi:hypothetical protein K2X33_15225 [bacterium]|nr:hypothetical protein [bacterium]